MDIKDIVFLDARIRREFCQVMPSLTPCENGFTYNVEGMSVTLSDAEAYAKYIQMHAAIPEKTTMKILDSLVFTVSAARAEEKPV